MAAMEAVRRHLSRAWSRLVPAKEVRVGDVTIRIDRQHMPKSLIRAIYRGDYELPERNAVLRILRKGDRVVEFGGGIGVVSMTAAKVTGPGTVHVFEPQPVACGLIRENAKRNALDITCTNAAVARESGTRTFWATSNIISSNLFGGRRDGKGETSTIEVKTIAFADIMKAHQPNVLIVDIEGAETEIFAGADLSNIDVIVIELHPHIVGHDAIDALEAHFVAQGLTSVPSLASADTRAYTRSRKPA